MSTKKKFVQFSDAENTLVSAVFHCVQPLEFYPHQGEVDEDDPRYLKHIRATSSDTEKSLFERIDRSADAARTKVIGDSLRVTEYDRAARQARTFVAANYEGVVPLMVAAYAINGRTAQQAADSILLKADKYEGALTQLRTVRLAAKEQIRVLFVSGSREDIEKAKSVVDQAVLAIEAAVAGLENNA